MSAQSMRLNAVASNMANADSVVSADGRPYRAKQVVFEATSWAAPVSYRRGACHPGSGKRRAGTDGL